MFESRPVQVRVDWRLLERVDAECKRTRLSRSQVIRWAALKGLNHDVSDLSIALIAWARQNPDAAAKLYEVVAGKCKPSRKRIAGRPKSRQA